MKRTDVLIVGNGIAGLSCAEELRKKDPDMAITMVTRESYPTYYRVRLTKSLAEETPIDRMLVKKEDWYIENSIELILNEIVEKLVLDEKKVVLDSGRELGYDKLVLAMGSRPFVPPVAGKFRRGVFALRDYDDLGQIKSYIEDLDSIAVVGGGLLGLEAAWALKNLGKEVHIIEMADRILPRQLSPDLSQRLEEDLKDEGFKLYLGAEIDEIFGESRMEGIRLKDSTIIDSKAVLFSVGIRPYLDLVYDTGLEMDKGLIVNQYLETNIEDVYAAGDLVEYDSRVLGLWTASMEMGRLVGRNIVGEREAYSPKSPYTSLRLGDSIDIFSIGDNANYDDSHEIVDGDFLEKLFIRDGALVGAILYGSTKKMAKLKSAVERGLSLEEYLKL